MASGREVAATDVLVEDPAQRADAQVRTVRLLAPAKVNLHLGIYPGRDERGYHRADSVMIAVDLADVVTVTEDPRLTGIQLSMSEDVHVPAYQNTAWIAATRMCRKFGRPERYAIHIQKEVPPQSGLGGSSSDAASVILALCKLWGIKALDPRVVQVARSVGADVAFFLHPAPSLLVGAGDVLEKTFPQMNDLPLVLVRPRPGVSTVSAYQAFDAHPTQPARADRLTRALARGDRRAVATHLFNNLATAVQRSVTECAEVEDWLLAQEGVQNARVTGSGSCAFAICDSHERAAGLARAAHDAHADWWAISCKTVGLGSQFC